MVIERVSGRMEIKSRLIRGFGPGDLGDVPEDDHHRHVVSCAAPGEFDHLRVGASDLVSKFAL